MNCEDFRTVNATDKSFVEATKAERAACGNHYDVCRECREFIANSVPDDPSKPPIKAVIETLNLLCDDFSDPEVLCMFNESRTKTTED